jgi:hypothetical protein
MLPNRQIITRRFIRSPRRRSRRCGRAAGTHILFEDIAAAIAIAVCTFAISKAKWFGLAAAW